MDYARLVPGWERMGPSEQLRARTRLSLQLAGTSSRMRDREEAEEAIQDAEREGKKPKSDAAAAAATAGHAEAVGQAARRPWTRFVFDRCAALDGEGARPSLAFLDERDGAGSDAGEDGEEGGPRGGPAGQNRAGGEGGGGDGVGLNALSFRASSQVAAQRQRDSGHDAAIFGSGPQLAKALPPPPPLPPLPLRERQQLPLAVMEAAARAAVPVGCSHTPAADVLLCTVAVQGGDDEDGPVVVTEEELIGAMARAAGGEMLAARSRPAAGGIMSESAEVRERQQTMSWRERAVQARLKKRG